MENIDVVIVGGGPAGLAAAIRLYEQGVKNIIILEREKQMGGILKQCIHDGFGLTRFGETLSGPEYASRFVRKVLEYQIPYQCNSCVVSISQEKIVTVATREGMMQYQAKVVILSMGCRERTRGALGIPGERPAGVFTAGVAQAYMNLFNRMPGKEVIILGSGDIGMIMARRMTLEGAHVQAVFEIQPYPSGLPRNIQQCLKDYEIPLFLSHTITQIHGKSRLEGVTVAKVDEHMKPIPGTEKEYTCDTLILSVGLLPENELSIDAGVSIDPRTKGAYVDENLQTSIPGIFAAGNVLHVHDLVDFVSMEAEKSADSAAEYVRAEAQTKDENEILPACEIEIKPGNGIGHTVPQKISGMKDFTLFLRVNCQFENVKIVVEQDHRVIAEKRMKKVLPAEMLQIPVKTTNINRKSEIEVRAEVEA